MLAQHVDCSDRRCSCGDQYAISHPAHLAAVIADQYRVVPHNAVGTLIGYALASKKPEHLFANIGYPFWSEREDVDWQVAAYRERASRCPQLFDGARFFVAEIREVPEG